MVGRFAFLTFKLNHNFCLWVFIIVLPSTGEAESGESLGLTGQPSLSLLSQLQFGGRPYLKKAS